MVLKENLKNKKTYALQSHTLKTTEFIGKTVLV